ncbi:hypothetical protein DICVIV_09515 [Dictyocaulus viviparus]|uniref:Uncharacterized protein n=1 Tax=Dictyocaulus viviparus TaxID=29172 RepID=A0A0D8XPZ5_DICVI|nr:hypothetical protein DICVIV_09515 [Dictyocaulus viviparus]
MRLREKETGKEGMMRTDIRRTEEVKVIVGGLVVILMIKDNSSSRWLSPPDLLTSSLLLKAGPFVMEPHREVHNHLLQYNLSGNTIEHNPHN